MIFTKPGKSIAKNLKNQKVKTSTLTVFAQPPLEVKKMKIKKNFRKNGRLNRGLSNAFNALSKNLITAFGLMALKSFS